MNRTTCVFISVMAALVLGTVYFSYSGTLLPGPERASSVSLRDVQARRTHFMRYYAYGK